MKSKSFAWYYILGTILWTKDLRQKKTIEPRRDFSPIDPNAVRRFWKMKRNWKRQKNWNQSNRCSRFGIGDQIIIDLFCPLFISRIFPIISLGFKFADKNFQIQLWKLIRLNFPRRFSHFEANFFITESPDCDNDSANEKNESREDVLLSDRLEGRRALASRLWPSGQVLVDQPVDDSGFLQTKKSARKNFQIRRIFRKSPRCTVLQTVYLSLSCRFAFIWQTVIWQTVIWQTVIWLAVVWPTKYVFKWSELIS